MIAKWQKILWVAALAFIAGKAGASPELPTGPTVVRATNSGVVTITNPSSNTLNIASTSKRFIIDWGSFSIGAGGRVNFAMPDRASIGVNRVTGTSRSTIAGDLWSNGNIWLLNPNGILFSNTARVDVAGLLATPANLLNIDDFIATNGNYIPPTTGNEPPIRFIMRPGDVTVVQGAEILVRGGPAIFIAGNPATGDPARVRAAGTVTSVSSDVDLLELSNDVSGVDTTSLRTNQTGSPVEDSDFDEERSSQVVFASSGDFGISLIENQPASTPPNPLSSSDLDLFTLTTSPFASAPETGELIAIDSTALITAGRIDIVSEYAPCVTSLCAPGIRVGGLLTAIDGFNSPAKELNVLAKGVGLTEGRGVDTSSAILTAYNNADVSVLGAWINVGDIDARDVFLESTGGDPSDSITVMGSVNAFGEVELKSHNSLYWDFSSVSSAFKVSAISTAGDVCIGIDCSAPDDLTVFSELVLRAPNGSVFARDLTATGIEIRAGGVGNHRVQVGNVTAFSGTVLIEGEAGISAGHVIQSASVSPGSNGIELRSPGGGAITANVVNAADRISVIGGELNFDSVEGSFVDLASNGRIAIDNQVTATTGSVKLSASHQVRTGAISAANAGAASGNCADTAVCIETGDNSSSDGYAVVVDGIEVADASIFIRGRDSICIGTVGVGVCTPADVDVEKGYLRVQSTDGSVTIGDILAGGSSAYDLLDPCSFTAVCLLAGTNLSAAMNPGPLGAITVGSIQSTQANAAIRLSGFGTLKTGASVMTNNGDVSFVSDGGSVDASGTDIRGFNVILEATGETSSIAYKTVNAGSVFRLINDWGLVVSPDLLSQGRTTAGWVELQSSGSPGYVCVGTWSNGVCSPAPISRADMIFTVYASRYIDIGNVVAKSLSLQTDYPGNFPGINRPSAINVGSVTTTNEFIARSNRGSITVPGSVTAGASSGRGGGNC